MSTLVCKLALSLLQASIIHYLSPKATAIAAGAASGLAAALHLWNRSPTLEAMNKNLHALVEKGKKAGRANSTASKGAIKLLEEIRRESAVEVRRLHNSLEFEPFYFRPFFRLHVWRKIQRARSTVMHLVEEILRSEEERQIEKLNRRLADMV
ncbi:hypothetical protein C8J56DRAFT_893997 [Mycena floridula]|nr:hypothetical protein C8J56DRAFT_893997 [Mycena floridula]